jgi:RimJ/RimL family protein N-acetyltransferase
MTTVLETDRLVLRRFDTGDADFIIQLLNEPAFIANIGDRGIRTREHATQYLTDGPIASYERHGHGLYLAVLKDSLTPIGICGLLKRDLFDHIDIGYAFLSDYWYQGYAFESASAVLEYARNSLGAATVIALVSPENLPSIRLLEKLGFGFSELRQMKQDDLPTAIYTNPPRLPVN